jgi:hypothetical protein
MGKGGDHSMTLMSRGGELIQRIYEGKNKNKNKNHIQ